jgi:uncharacterized membrane protein YcaP (DUF421 family)
MSHLAELFGFSIPVWETVLRGSVMYLALFLLFRFVAPRSVGALNVSDLLVLVLVADAAQNGMAGEYKSISDGILLVSTLIAWDALIDWAAFHWGWASWLAEPAPLPLVRNGHVLRRNLRRQMMTPEDLQAQLRNYGVEDVREVRKAYIESDGQFTVILREGARARKPPRGPEMM